MESLGRNIDNERDGQPRPQPGDERITIMSLDMSSMKKILPVLLICLLMLAGGTALYVPDVAAEEAAAAPAAPVADKGDTAWILASSALVMLMTMPGLALFYG